MRIEHSHHTGEDVARVEGRPVLRVGNSCELPSCHCSDGPFVMLGAGVKDGSVHVVTAKMTIEELMLFRDSLDELIAGEVGYTEYFETLPATQER